MPYLVRNLIGGEWLSPDANRQKSNFNPAHAAEAVTVYPVLGYDETKKAIDAAHRAFATWAKTPVAHRAAVLYKAADYLLQHDERLARLLTSEEGKTYNESLVEVRRSADALRFYAGIGQSLVGESFPVEGSEFVYTLVEPLGVVGVVTPWNFPISIPTRKIAPALITGNTVVFKPASLTPGIGSELVLALEAGGLPAGVLNFVTGQAGPIGDALTSDSRVAAITFTGSTEVGRQLQRAVPGTTRVQLELGGKNPMVIWHDADLVKAAELTIRGGLFHSGQACTGTSRVIIHEKVYEPFLEILTEAMKKLTFGDSMQRDVQIGPMASQAQVDSFTSYFKMAKAEGAKWVTGGGRLTGVEYDQGYYVMPALFRDVRPEMRIAREEVFGPILAAFSVASESEAIALANDTDYGLTAAICTKDLGVAHRFASQVAAGVVKVNRSTTGNAIQVPFGGVKASSTATYRESGAASLQFYVQTKTVYLGF